MLPRPSPNASDHDVLIEIRTTLNLLSNTVSQNHNDVVVRMNDLDKGKAGYKDLDVLRATMVSRMEDAERAALKRDTDNGKLAEKVDWTRRMIWIAIGALGSFDVFGTVLAIVAILRTFSR